MLDSGRAEHFANATLSSFHPCMVCNFIYLPSMPSRVKAPVQSPQLTLTGVFCLPLAGQFPAPGAASPCDTIVATVALLVQSILRFGPNIGLHFQSALPPYPSEKRHWRSLASRYEERTTRSPIKQVDWGRLCQVVWEVLRRVGCWRSYLQRPV